jgi:thiol:disulfide interchange protein DsbD
LGYAVLVLLFFTLYLPRKSQAKPRLARQASIIILALAIALLFGVLQGTSQFLEHMLGVKGAPIQSADPIDFTFITNLSELKAALMKAKTENKPVILDFYADWCDACHEMDKQVFASSKVKSLLKNFIRLRVDLTNNNESYHALMEKYQVIAPPTVLFFNRQGEELSSRRIVGEVSETEFLNRLNSLITASCGQNALC